jgi:hypothetical protein
VKPWLQRWGPALAVALCLLSAAALYKVHWEASREAAWAQRSPAPSLEHSFAAQQAGASGQGLQALGQAPDGQRRLRAAQAGGRTWWSTAQVEPEPRDFAAPGWGQRALGFLAWLAWMACVGLWIARARDERGEPTRWGWPLVAGGGAAAALWLLSLAL